MWNIQEKNSSISIQRKRKKTKPKNKTNPNFVDPKKQFQFVHNKVGLDGNRSKNELSKFL